MPLHRPVSVSFKNCHPDQLIYVDTCSNIEGGLVKNADLLTKIRVVKDVRWVRGIDGSNKQFKVNKRGYLPIFEWAWYSPRASHNILSFWDLNERCTDMHYDKCERTWRFAFRRSSSDADSTEDGSANQNSSRRVTYVVSAQALSARVRWATTETVTATMRQQVMSHYIR